MLSYIKKIRKNIPKLAILSNMTKEVLEYLRKLKTGLLYLIRQFFSCEHFVCKPDKAIYEICINAMKIQPDTCLFIDDMIVNIQGAENYGLKTLHYKSFAISEKEINRILCLNDEVGT